MAADVQYKDLIVEKLVSPVLVIMSLEICMPSSTSPTP